VVESALEEIKTWGDEVVGIVFLGGTEKLSSYNFEAFKAPVFKEKDYLKSVKKALLELQPEMVLDLSDEPILGYRERFQLASLILSMGVTYMGSDFRFDPPVFYDVVKKPSIALIGTGKRVGKTAISAYLARLLKANNYWPIVVAMGRGGPAEPEFLRGDEENIDPSYLLKAWKEGKHAASDYFEDALVSRVKTIGARRCGGGLAGMPFITNVRRAASMANTLNGKIVIFEGSGASIPPIKVNKTILTAAANQPLEYILGFLGPYRLYLSSLVVLTQCEEPLANPEKIRAITDGLKRIKPEVQVVWTRFRPRPLESIKGEKVFLVLTASSLIRDKLKAYVEEKFDCEVVGISTNLSNQELLKNELSLFADKCSLVLTELKASAVELVTRFALEKGLKIVYTDNEPETIGGDLPLDKALLNLSQEAIANYKQ